MTSALFGVWLAALQYAVWWTALSQLSSLAVGVSYAALAAYPFLHPSRKDEPASPWLRGALATQMLLVSIAYLVTTPGGLSDPYSVFEHLVTPALVVADFVLVGGNQSAVRWWHPVSWLLPSAAYAGYYVLGDLRVYVALDPSQPGPFAARMLMLLGLTLTAGLVLYAVGRARSSAFQKPDAISSRSFVKPSVQPFRCSSSRASVANSPCLRVSAVASPTSSSDSSTLVSRSSGSGSSQRNV